MGSRRSFLVASLALGAVTSVRATAGRQTEQEAAAGIVPSRPEFAPGDVRRYGAALDGTTDDTRALATWSRVGGALTFPVARTALISAAIPLSAGTTISAVPGAALQLTVADQSFFTATGQSSISISGLHFRQTLAGAKAYVAGVLLDGCDHCVVENNEFEGLQWAGVQLLNSRDCIVRGNRFHDWQGDVQDSADVCIYQASANNVIEGNELNGGGCHGVLCQDPYAGLVPRGNTIAGNRVGRHITYGITVYCPGPGGAGDSNNKVVDNEVRDIEGSSHRNPSSGAGIYVSGAWAGGTQVSGNRVSNCCVRTLQRSLAPAGIGLNGASTAATPPVFADNVVSGMTQGDGILIVSSPGGCFITGGSIEVPAANRGTGPGGKALLGSGIRIENSSHVRVRGTRVVAHGQGHALFVYSRQIVMDDIVIEAGNFSSNGAAATVRIEGGGVDRITNLSMVGTHATAAADGPALLIAGVYGGQLQELEANSGAQPALDLSRSSNLRVSGGHYTASAAMAVRIAGDCSGSVLERSMTRLGAAGGVDNEGWGVRIE